MLPCMNQMLSYFGGTIYLRLSPHQKEHMLTDVKLYQTSEFLLIWGMNEDLQAHTLKTNS